MLLFEFLQVLRSGGPVTAHCQESTGRGLDGTHHPVRRTDSPRRRDCPPRAGDNAVTIWEVRRGAGRGDNAAGAMIVDLWEEPLEVSG